MSDARAESNARNRHRWPAIVAAIAAVAVLVGSVTTWAADRAGADTGGVEISTRADEQYIRAGKNVFTRVGYTTTVHNAGAEAVSNVTVTQTVPDLATTPGWVSPRGPGATYDQDAGIVSWTIPSLAAGESAQLPLETYLGGSDSISAGQQSTSTATITSPAPCGAASCESSATVTVVAVDPLSFQLEQSAEVLGVEDADGAIQPSVDRAQVGDTVHFRLALTNTSPVPISDIEFKRAFSTTHQDEWQCSILEQGERRADPTAEQTDEPTADASDATGITLPAGGIYECLLAWRVTQDDVDHGRTPSAQISATAKYADGTWVRTQESPVAKVSLPATAPVRVETTVDKTTARPGDPLTYTITVTNLRDDALGNLTVRGVLPKQGLSQDLADLQVSDDGRVSTAEDGSLVITWARGNALLAAHGTLTLTVTAKVATDAAEGTEIGGRFIVAADACTAENCEASASTTVVGDEPEAPSGALSVRLVQDSITDASGAARPDGEPARLGDTIHYTWWITNDTSEKVENVGSWTDGIETEGCTPGTSAALEVGESMRCTGHHTVTESDLDAGRALVAAWGVARRLDDSGTVTSERPTATTPVTEAEQSSATELTVTKTARLESGAAIAKLGDTIDYTVTVTNSGQAATSGVTVTDPMFPDGMSCEQPDEARLAPGDELVCRGQYEVTADDVEDGGITNTATADTADETEPATASVTVPTGGLTIDASATVTSASGERVETARPGDTIGYRVTVTNASSVPIGNVAVATDWLTGDALTCTLAGVPESGPGVLDPRDTLECTATHVVTDEDAAAGHVGGTVAARGTWQDDVFAASGPVTATTTLSTPVEALPASAGLVVTKTARLIAPRPIARAGDVVTYRVTVRNASQTPAANVRVKDPMFPYGMLCSILPKSTLAPGRSLTCVGTHFVTRAEIRAGSLTNTATATTSTKGLSATTATAVTPLAGLRVKHTAEVTKAKRSASPRAQRGDTIRYTITATNESDLAMTKVQVSAPLLALHGVPLTCQVGSTDVTLPADLPAGATLTCTTPAAGQAGAYVVSSLDARLGRVVSVATVTAAWTGPAAASGTVAPAAATVTTSTAR